MCCWTSLLVNHWVISPIKSAINFPTADEYIIFLHLILASFAELFLLFSKILSMLFIVEALIPYFWQIVLTSSPCVSYLLYNQTFWTYVRWEYFSLIIMDSFVSTKRGYLDFHSCKSFSPIPIQLKLIIKSSSFVGLSFILWTIRFISDSNSSSLRLSVTSFIQIHSNNGLLNFDLSSSTFNFSRVSATLNSSEYWSASIYIFWKFDMKNNLSSLNLLFGL